MFGCSLRPPGMVTPAIAAEFNRSFKLVRALPCDVQLGDHGAQYNMQQKFARVRTGGRNPFIDPASCTLEADIEEAMFHAHPCRATEPWQPVKAASPRRFSVTPCKKGNPRIQPGGRAPASSPRRQIPSRAATA